MSRVDLATVLQEWSLREPSVSGLVLIGSRQRSESDLVWRADADSDWDFQIITSTPQRFLSADWMKALPGVSVTVYAVRMTKIGAVPKVNVVFEGGEADFIILPERLFKMGRLLTWLGVHKREGGLRRGLQDLAVVIRPGWRFLKGQASWEAFYRRVVDGVPDPRLSDGDVRRLADGFVADYVWTLRKLRRGEWVAARRMLHRELLETNLRLLHEARRREGLRSFPEGRRIERILSGDDLAGVSVSGGEDSEALHAALEQAAGMLRSLSERLLKGAWTWPVAVSSGR